MHFGDTSKPTSVYSGTGTGFQRNNSLGLDTTDPVKRKKFVGTNNGMVCEVERIEKLRTMLQSVLTESRFYYIVKLVLSLVTGVVNCRDANFYSLGHSPQTNFAKEISIQKTVIENRYIDCLHIMGDP
jgi:hypothetical protein